MNVEWVRWTGIPQGLVKDFARTFSEQAPTELIANANTTVRVLRVGSDTYFPVTVNNTEWNASFVCSPFTAYVLYAKDELMRKVSHRAVRWPLLLVIKLLSRLLKLGSINRNVHVNNFLLSTNPYPEWGGHEIKAITTFITKEYPHHAIVFRSLNEYQHHHLLARFRAARYQWVASRQVYTYDLTYEDWLKRRNNRHDNKLITKKALTFLDHDQMKSYLAPARQLYNQLYLKKYSEHNPQFTLSYFKACYQRHLIHFQGYADAAGTLRAFAGLFIVGNTITSPLVGYDTDSPPKEGLYRHAAQLAVRHKFKTGLLLNLSSGAPGFKRTRGGEPSIEYSTVYTAHLSLRRRFAWQTIALLSNKIGVPIMKKYRL